MRFRLIALDADGTALDPDGRVRPAVRAAVGAAQQRGVRVVLCTGRRYRTALPILEALELDGAAVVHNGAVVKDAHNGATLHHNYLPRDLYPVALSIMRKLGPPLVYVDHYHENLDLVTETPERSHPYQEEYWRDNTDVGRVVDSLDRPPSDALVLMSCMADRESCQALRQEISAALGDRVRTNLLVNKNYRGYILETVSSSSGKWPALLQVAAGEGISAEEILAIGDDENDAEMIAHAGLGVAMRNAVETARTAAKYITGSNAEDGVAQAIERFVLRGQG
ncbi:MAG: Cof-type HAD-IIB family hydrolase [Myxococcota bacterium]